MMGSAAPQPAVAMEMQTMGGTGVGIVVPDGPRQDPMLAEQARLRVENATARWRQRQSQPSAIGGEEGESLYAAPPTRSIEEIQQLMKSKDWKHPTQLMVRPPSRPAPLLAPPL